MDFYLTNYASGVRLRLPLLPDRLNVKTGALSVSLTIIKSGEIKIPRGSSLTGYSWSSIFPGESMKDASFVFDWQPPQRIIDLLRFWEENGDTLHFMVTELSVNADVFIESFTYEYFGTGNASYSISLAVRRELLISSVPANISLPSTANTGAASTGSMRGVVTIPNTSSYLNIRQQASTGSKSLGRLNHGAKIDILQKSGNWFIIPFSSGIDGKAYVYSAYVTVGTQNATSSIGNKQSSANPLKAGASTYTVRSGDTLFSIAKECLGSGNRYTEIYRLNSVAIDSRNKGKSVSMYTVYPGQILKLPDV